MILEELKSAISASVSYASMEGKGVNGLAKVVSFRFSPFSSPGAGIQFFICVLASNHLTVVRIRDRIMVEEDALYLMASG